ncbi:MAG: CotH kinase family protein [Aeromicrobium sp.]
MNSKPITSFFVALVSAVLLVPLLGAGSLASAVPSAFQPANIPHPGGDDGNLGQDPATFVNGQTVTFSANFASSASGSLVTLYKESTPGNFVSTGQSDAANTYGNAYINYAVTGDQRVFALAANGDVTEIDNLNPGPAGPSGVTLSPITTVGADARANAKYSPIDSGSLTRLQVRTIDDGSWQSVTTSTQRSDGTTTFNITDPLEVEHDYRAVGPNGQSSNIVKYAGPLFNKNNDVPTVHFNSNDGESVNTRERWFEGQFSILSGGQTDQNKDGALENCGAVNKVDGEMRGRGNYSWSFDKKGFNLKFDDSFDFCGMGNSKKWALVANHYDRSLLRNSAAGFVGQMFSNLEFTPKDSAVDLYVNGSFRGSYILIERVNFEGGRLDEEELKAEETPAICSGPDPSVDTTSIINGSYLMEWDFRKGANFNFGSGDGHGWVGLKEPEDEDYCQNMGAYINDYVDRADRDLYDGTASSNDWMSSIDLASAVDYYIAMEFLKPVDGQMWASVYMYKPRGEKIHFGPLWDFDLAMGSANRAGNVVSPSGWYLRNPLNVSAKQTEITWFNRMNQNPTFRAAVVTRWNQIDQDLNDVIAYVRNQENLIDGSASDNYIKWSHGSKISQYQVIKSSWGADVDYLADWLDKRWIYMNSQLDNND